MKWISVKDRLPELNTIVLGTYGVTIGHYTVSSFFYDGQYFWNDETKFGEPFIGIPYWMSLPEPPKE